MGKVKDEIDEESEASFVGTLIKLSDTMRAYIKENLFEKLGDSTFGEAEYKKFDSWADNIISKILENEKLQIEERFLLKFYASGYTAGTKYFHRLVHYHKLATLETVTQDIRVRSYVI